MTDLTHIDTWLFDLDNTLYPIESEVMTLVSGRMTDFMERVTGLPREEARAIQKRYYHEHGTTLAGLMANNHGVDPEDFLTAVHDVSLDALAPDPALTAGLERLPGRRLVFTNGSASHAERVLDKLGIAHVFEDIFHIAAAGYIPKPSPVTFGMMIARHGVTASGAAFFEDSEHNLAPAAALGMTTVLVGAHAADSTAAFVHHRARHLADFLNAIRVKEPDA